MTLTLLGIHENELYTLDSDNMLIINKGNWDIYWKLATEDLKVEYIEERIYIHSPVSLIHERIFRELIIKLTEYTKKNKLGEVLGSRFPIQLVDGKRSEPDIFFISNKDKKEGELTETLFKGKPSWIIEIISPSYREHDTVTKRKQYRMLDVEEYWIIDPEIESIEIVQFKNKIEISSQKLSKGEIKPSINGFQDFSLQIETLWDKEK
jgi:Uma2 family endonuclease